MKKLLSLTFTLATFFLMNSCATVFSSSDYQVTVKSTPANADIQVSNRAGSIVYEGKTPAKMNLNASAGYLKKEKYVVDFPQYNDGKVIQAKLDGWYWVNFLWLGASPTFFLGVDPITGAMYRLDKFIHVNLENNNLNKPQKGDKVDVIYLNNGSKIQGTIIIRGDEEIKFRSIEGNEYILDKKNVEKTTQEKYDGE